MHEPLMIASKHLTVLCVSKRCLPSLLIDEVDIITSELVLRCFVVYLDTGGGGETMVTSGGITASSPYTKKKDVSLVA
jgi:hypothetical protein